MTYYTIRLELFSCQQAHQKLAKSLTTYLSIPSTWITKNFYFSSSMHSTILRHRSPWTGEEINCMSESAWNLRHILWSAPFVEPAINSPSIVDNISTAIDRWQLPHRHSSGRLHQILFCHPIMRGNFSQKFRTKHHRVFLVCYLQRNIVMIVPAICLTNDVFETKIVANAATISSCWSAYQ